ncbi:MAG TPA: glycogen debranching enzyme N-terminal domain-containing protein, partial [Polyangiales bacterium]|nr:glycogen debranching enzyme N-terminal domain-containing protein [Polyangiales bacterium]
MASTSELEWLETNARGSFALACVDRKLRRKYHALLTVRDPGRGEPWNVLAETRETLSAGAASTLLVDPLSTISAKDTPFTFQSQPHATHIYLLQDGRVELARSVRLGARDQVEVHFRVRARGEVPPLSLQIEPLLRCRPLHALTHENPFLDGTCVKLGDEVRML